jgi:hypothetical protein
MAEDYTVTLEKADLDLVPKYKELMEATLGDGSLYERAKATMAVNFDDLNLSAPEKAAMVSEHVASLTSQLSSAAMSAALQWSKEERDGAYALAKVHADIGVSLAQKDKVAHEVDLVKEQIEKIKAETIATKAQSIRENGVYVPATDTDAEYVTNAGLKYEQTRQVTAAMYQTLADTYRKSGVVSLETDDGILKGTANKTGVTYTGYTDQQIKNAERQRVAYEDSKVNHAANSGAAVIGTIINSEQYLDPELVTLYKKALTRLTTKAENMSDIG